jgi:hypothetical protein
MLEVGAITELVLSSAATLSPALSTREREPER